jgi:hypothetical protein
MPIKSTDGAVTTVPMSALSLGPDGNSRIQIDNGGALEFVSVDPGLVADGYVEISPKDRKLEAGQLVVVGNGASDLLDVNP